MKILLATCVALLVCAAPAHAVIGGERVDESTVPWFAGVGGCGGTVVAPDRVVTAAHCVAGATLTDFNRFEPGSTARRVTGVSMAPGWERRNGRNFLDDVAIVRFDRPFEGVMRPSRRHRRGNAMDPRPRDLGGGGGRPAAPCSAARALRHRVRAGLQARARQ